MEPHESVYLYSAIIACELAFWLLIALGLAARYLLQRHRISRALLIAVPVVDLLLLAFTTLDLRAGAPATFAHGLATAYVGFTVAFGGVLIAWADQRFAHRFAGGPPPAAAPQGWQAVRYELALWLRCIVAALITAALLTAMIGYIDDAAITRELHDWFRIVFGSVVLWFAFGPVWSLLFFRPRGQQR